VLKKYDRDQNDLLDPAGWQQYRQDVEKQGADWKWFAQKGKQGSCSRGADQTALRFVQAQRNLREIGGVG
jgi:hypothetical protein